LHGHPGEGRVSTAFPCQVNEPHPFNLWGFFFKNGRQSECQKSVASACSLPDWAEEKTLAILVANLNSLHRIGLSVSRDETLCGKHTQRNGDHCKNALGVCVSHCHPPYRRNPGHPSGRTHHAVDHILIYFAVDYQMARNAVDGFLMRKQ
jgi:hypothetical protein